MKSTRVLLNFLFWRCYAPKPAMRLSENALKTLGFKPFGLAALGRQYYDNHQQQSTNSVLTKD
jgi:hypothetical protein